MNSGQQASRIAPLGRPDDYITYSISAGRDTGIVYTCQEVGCEYWREGWDSPVDERTEQGRLWAWAIRHESRRDFDELKRGDGVTVFRFKPYQRCFQDHETLPDVFRVRDGDWRGNPTQRIRLHANGLDWIEDLVEHEGGLADLRAKG
jgi:hypothetical protein